jgi:hypothetical protein
VGGLVSASTSEIATQKDVTADFLSTNCRLTTIEIAVSSRVDIGFRCRPSAFAAHWCPPSCVELGHFEFTIWLLMRRVRGAARAASAPNYGFVSGPGRVGFVPQKKRQVPR